MEPYSVKSRPWPRPHTIVHQVARYFVGKAAKHGSPVSINELLIRESISEQQLTRFAYELTTRYGFFCRALKSKPGYYEVSTLGWPKVIKTASSERVVGVDPRVGAPKTKWKYRPLPENPNLPLAYVARYLLRNREPKTHLCDCYDLYLKVPAIVVSRKITALNKFYGFKIRKHVKGRRDNLWIVDRLPNRRL